MSSKGTIQANQLLESQHRNSEEVANLSIRQKMEIKSRMSMTKVVLAMPKRTSPSM